jgi:hypothetical protein
MKNWETTRQRILNVPNPNFGGKYAYIPHSVFLEEIEQELKSSGKLIIDEAYNTTKDAKIISGWFKVQDPNITDLELAPVITFTNSVNKMVKASIRASALVLVCKNGMMGSIAGGSYTRKHLGDNALPDFRKHIVEVVASLEDEFNRLVKNKEEMKVIELSTAEIGFLIGDMYVNEEMITANQLSTIKRELKRSKNFSGGTLWDFYNNVTEGLKDTHPLFYEKQHIKFHTYVSDKYNLTGSRGLYGKGGIFTKLNTSGIEEIEVINTELVENEFVHVQMPR